MRKLCYLHTVRTSRRRSPWWRRYAVLATSLAAGLLAPLAHASTLDSSGHLVFDTDAVLTEGFESLSGAQAQGASWLTWAATGDSERPPLQATAVTASDWSANGSAPGAVSLASALEGSYALKLTTAGPVALGLVDTAFFATLVTKRIQVSFWGMSMGAEPELDIVYPSTSEAVGPVGFGHIVAIRTGRETSDGWVEYSTGPIDGSLFGNDPIAAIILTARYATENGTAALDSFDLAPPDPDTILDSTAYALADAVEVEPAPGSPMPFVQCTQATATTACGSLGECTFGRCVDGSVVWGAVPQAADHRTDLVNRWAFIAEHLGADRRAASNAPTVFSSSSVSTITSATTAPGFYGGLNTLVNSLRDGHTGLGVGPSDYTSFWEGMTTFNASSDWFDLCFGLAEDDVPGGTGGPVYSVFWMAPASALGASFGGKILPGDMLTQIDGETPDAWLDAVGPRFRYTLPNDPTSEPDGRALLLSEALSKYAQTAEFSSCTAAGSCTTKTVAVSAIMEAMLTGTTYGGTSFQNATTSSRRCTGRFTDSVSTWGPSNDESNDDVPVEESAGGIAILEFDGFEGAYDSTDPSNPYHAWADPFYDALTSGENVLVDARLGHGGKFSLGQWLAHDIRGTTDPYFTFAVPRGAWDTIDPSWLFDPSLATCVDWNDDAPDFCGWTAGHIDESMLSAPPAGTAKIAWVNGDDVSMNDIVPHDIVGAANVRTFGPHPTTGAYGEIAYLPPIVAGWDTGSIQVLDMRFGTSFDTAVASAWESGTGVPPDQVVLQKVSDILGGTDTVLTAAKTWLAQ